jgi:hypothetical protein
MLQNIKELENAIFGEKQIDICQMQFLEQSE